MSFSRSVKPEFPSSEHIKSELFAPRVFVTVEAADSVAELYVYDRTQTEMVRGVGRLVTQLAPGEYNVRQRVGDVESYEDMRIPNGESEFCWRARERLSFLSPLPLEGTVPAEDTLGMLRPPEAAGGREPLRVTVRIPWDSSGRQIKLSALTHLRDEVGRLSLETLEGHALIGLREARHQEGFELDQGAFHVEVTLDPGVYSLVHRGRDGKKRCMSVYVFDDLAPHICLLVLQDGDSGAPIEVDLDNAAMVFRGRGAQLSALALLQLEVIRKAIGRGRVIWGDDWSASEDVTLALLAGQMRLPTAKRPGAMLQTHGALNVLGTDFPDQIACKMAFDGIDAPSLKGPPLMRRSWDVLSAKRGTSAILGEVMPSKFAVEKTSTWFIWSTKDEVETVGHASSERFSSPDQAIFPSVWTSVKGRLASSVKERFGFDAGLIFRSTAAGATKGNFRETSSSVDGQGSNAGDGVDSRPTVARAGADEAIPEELQGRGSAIFNLEDAVGVLVRLAKSNEFASLLSRIDEYAEDALSSSSLVKDPDVQKLLYSLLPLLNPALLKAFGAEKLVRAGLASLQESDLQIVDSVRKLFELRSLAALRALAGVVENLVDEVRPLPGGV